MDFQQINSESVLPLKRLNEGTPGKHLAQGLVCWQCLLNVCFITPGAAMVGSRLPCTCGTSEAELAGRGCVLICKGGGAFPAKTSLPLSAPLGSNTFMCSLILQPV